MSTISLGSETEVKLRRAKLLVELARVSAPLSGTALAHRLRRGTQSVIADLVALRKAGLVIGDGKPAVWSLP